MTQPDPALPNVCKSNLPPEGPRLDRMSRFIFPRNERWVHGIEVAGVELYIQTIVTLKVGLNKTDKNHLSRGKYFFGMTLMAQNRSLFIEIMTGNADFVSNFFTPSLNFGALSIMTMKAVILGKFLMFPVLEGHL